MAFIIADVAQSHDGSLGMAHAFIDAAKTAGVDAIKFQTHIAEAESSPQEPWRVKFSYQDATRYDYWKRMEFSEEQWFGLKKHAEEIGLVFLSSPFSIKAFRLLQKMNMKYWKIASGELSNKPLLDEIIHSANNILVSSGMSPLAEIDAVINRIKKEKKNFAVFQCTSKYPCPAEAIGANLIPSFKERYQCPVGLSDHSGKIYPSILASYLGAEFIEIHIALSKQMFGPDISSSLTPDEIKQMIEGIYFAEKMRENPLNKDQVAEELAPLRKIFTKSLVIDRDLSLGDIIRKEDLISKKPGIGIPADDIDTIVGKTVSRALPAGHFLSRHDLKD